MPTRLAGIPSEICDADRDTYIRVEQAPDEDIIRFGTAGVERATIDGDTLNIAEYLRHLGDIDTYIRFTADRIRLVAGGVDMIDITEAAQDVIEFNAAEADVDIIFNTLVADTLHLRGDTGKVGINTATIPHGGVGWAMLALDGVAGVNGPNIQFTTTVDDYPLIQIYPGSHDGISIYFDSYTDGVAKSSDVGSNFRITKATDLFRIQYDSGIAQGNAVTFNDGIVLDTAGNVTIPVNLYLGNLYIGEYIYHDGDADTHIRFTADRIRLVAGGVDMLDITEAAQDVIEFNAGEADVDIIFNTLVADTFHLRGDTGKVGINTATIPHGGIGYAMLALDGASAVAAGPHVQFTTASDDYPLMTLLNWSHDSVLIYFDSYLDAGGEKSSDVGSNFRIGKYSDLLRFQYDSGIVQGAVVTFNDGIVLTAGGKVGINTATIPHGGVGWAMLALDGGAAAAGPHIQFTTTTDDYPIMQIMPLGHDYVYLGFDCYYDGVWKSSDAGSNFLMVKGDGVNLFRIRYDSGIAQGAAVTWNDGIILDTAGNVTIPTGLPVASVKTSQGSTAGNVAAGAWALITMNVKSFFPGLSTPTGNLHGYIMIGSQAASYTSQFAIYNDPIAPGTDYDVRWYYLS